MVVGVFEGIWFIFSQIFSPDLQRTVNDSYIGHPFHRTGLMKIMRGHFDGTDGNWPYLFCDEIRNPVPILDCT